MQAPNRLGDVGEARWPLSHRWTDTSPTLPDAAYDTRNQGRVVSHSELSLLSACVRLCQLREVHHSLQQSLNPLRVRKCCIGTPSPVCVCTLCEALSHGSSLGQLTLTDVYSCATPCMRQKLRPPFRWPQLKSFRWPQLCACVCFQKLCI